MSACSAYESLRRFHRAIAVFGEHVCCRLSCCGACKQAKEGLFVFFDFSERACEAAWEPLVEDELMKDCRNFCSSLRDSSELRHGSHQRRNLPVTQSHEPPGDCLSREFSLLFSGCGGSAAGSSASAAAAPGAGARRCMVSKHCNSAESMRR